MQKFELKRIAEICPSTGEDLGGALARAAEAMSPLSHAKAQVYYLAAEAFEQGASASIGHNRSDRYLQRAKELRARAEYIEDALKAEADERQSASLLAAFDDGFAGRDITRHSFDQREAAQLGQLYASEGREMPKRLNKVYTPRPLGRDSEPDHLVDDLGQRFVVSYPDGKVRNPVITKLD